MNINFYEPLPDADEKRKMAARLVCWIGRQAIGQTFSSLADDVGIAQMHNERH